MQQKITLNDHDRAEFARMAIAADAANRHDVWFCFDVWSRHGEMRIADYDRAKDAYRHWLICNEFPLYVM
jgi:hypothetical protein